MELGYESDRGKNSFKSRPFDAGRVHDISAKVIILQHHDIVISIASMRIQLH